MLLSVHISFSDNSYSASKRALQKHWLSRHQHWLCVHTLSSSSGQGHEQAASTSACIKRQHCKAGSGGPFQFRCRSGPFHSPDYIGLLLPQSGPIVLQVLLLVCVHLILSQRHKRACLQYANSMQVAGDGSTLRQDHARCEMRSEHTSTLAQRLRNIVFATTITMYFSEYPIAGSWWKQIQ